MPSRLYTKESLSNLEGFGIVDVHVDSSNIAKKIK